MFSRQLADIKQILHMLLKRFRNMYDLTVVISNIIDVELYLCYLLLHFNKRKLFYIIFIDNFQDK